MNKIKVLFLLCFIVVGTWHLEKLYTGMRDRTANYEEYYLYKDNLLLGRIYPGVINCLPEWTNGEETVYFCGSAVADKQCQANCEKSAQ